MINTGVVNFDDPLLDSDLLPAAPPGVITIVPLPDGYTYDVSQLLPDDFDALLDECAAEHDRREKIKHEQCITEISTLINKAIHAGYIDHAEDLLIHLGYSITTPAALSTASPTNHERKSKAPPRYRDPADTSRTWSGRGKRPQWLQQRIAVHGLNAALDQCRIIDGNTGLFTVDSDD